MPESDLTIFEQASPVEPDRPIGRGIAAILLLAGIGAASVLGTVAVAGLVGGSVAEIFSASSLDAFALTDVTCRITDRDVVIAATVAEGPEHDGVVAPKATSWQSDELYFLPVTEGFRVGQRVEIRGPGDRAQRITGLEVDMSAGEVAFRQIIPLTVLVDGMNCIAHSHE